MAGELKQNTGRLSDAQRIKHKELERLGFKVVVLWNKADVDKFINNCC